MDACKFKLGAILSLSDEEGRLPSTLTSRKCLSAKTLYCTPELEALAIRFATKNLTVHKGKGITTYIYTNLNPFSWRTPKSRYDLLKLESENPVWINELCKCRRCLREEWTRNFIGNSEVFNGRGWLKDGESRAVKRK